MVGGPGSGEEVPGKWPGSSKGSNNSINTGGQSQEPDRPSKRREETSMVDI